MLTKADDFPVHQTSQPIATTATADRNFYDRYFFNGYDRDGSIYFAAAFGVYPNRNIIDAAFNVVRDGKQYILRASRRAGPERLDLQVGPIRIDVVEPLARLRIQVGHNDFGIAADLEFTRRAAPIEEPRFLRTSGERVWMDSTRLTQHGTWSGTISVGGTPWQVSPQRYWGSRDRSWGIRPIGERDASAAALPLQFFWLWAPLNFERLCTHFDVNEEADGKRWHSAGVRILPDECAAPGDAVELTTDVAYHLELKSGTRHARAASITLASASRDPQPIQLQPLYNFYMAGLGYGHPTWGHGMFVGENEIGGEVWTLSELDDAAPMHLHVQAICTAELGSQRGIGVLEQLILGPHQPTGLGGLFDPKP